jgi:phosphosulfolactate synthase
MIEQIPHLPEREPKPREKGVTMMMDKGLSVREAEDFVTSSGEFTDVVKFGFGTALITPDLKEKIRVYRAGNLRCYFGGTLFELFIIRNMFDEYRKLIDKYDLDLVEVSDGSMIIPHTDKLSYIKTLAQQVTVLSEVGSKQADVVFPPNVWVAMMKAEIDAGSWKVIAEARESGTVGIYNPDGTANTTLIDDIVKQVQIENVIWEAPIKSQQAWFIKLLGANVNLGNIAPDEVVALETLRLGLRGDTFYQFLPEDLKH